MGCEWMSDLILMFCISLLDGVMRIDLLYIEAGVPGQGFVLQRIAYIYGQFTGIQHGQNLNLHYQVFEVR